MKQYLDMLKTIIDDGYDTLNDRTGTGTRAVFGHQLRFNLQKGFPLVTTKEVSHKNIIHELLWMVSGSTNIKYLVDNNCNIWNEWPGKFYANKTGEVNWDSLTTKDRKKFIKSFATRIKEDEKFAAEWGSIGPGYGAQWRNWQYYDGGMKRYDQLQTIINRIKTYPTCRRLIINAWNAPLIDEMGVRGLPPCHFCYQFNVRSNQFLDCHMNIRSWDVFLGGSYNLAQYAFLTHMVAQVTGYEVGDLIVSSGNTHLYMNHISQAKLQLKRTPKTLPTLNIAKHANINYYTFNDFEIVGYKHHPKIKADISV